jgi:hypothetical protein
MVAGGSEWGGGGFERKLVNEELREGGREGKSEGSDGIARNCDEAPASPDWRLQTIDQPARSPLF